LLTLARASGLAFDREYALALGTTAFDPQNPEPLDKGYFLMLRSNEVLDIGLEEALDRLAALRPGQILAEHRRAVARDREHGSVISPAFMRAVSLINLASVRALEERTGGAIHPLRFRANITRRGRPLAAGPT
jgi:uncharacterized protein YcbX